MDDVSLDIDESDFDWEEVESPRVEMVTGLGSDWEAVMAILPTGWADKAHELGAVRRLRNFESVGTLLRVLMIHLADGCSLRDTALLAEQGALVNVSDVALLKRLRGCGAWFQWMALELAKRMAIRALPEDQLGGRQVRLIDGTTVSEPGATGSSWRIHYSFNLHSLACDEVHVTSIAEGETLKRFAIHEGEVIMADRGFANRGGLRHVVQHNADVLLRMNLTNLPLQDGDGNALQLLPKLRSLSVGQAGAWAAWARDEQGLVEVRVCAYKKTAAQTLQAQNALQREATKKKRKVGAETMEGCGYVLVITTLRDLSAAAVLELYRRRWQIELAFKRLKSILQLGHLKKFDPEGSKAWLQGKVLVACLIETLILTAERFSPWGYAVDDRGTLTETFPLA